MHSKNEYNLIALQIKKEYYALQIKKRILDDKKKTNIPF